jgi:hypothetical protein
MPQKHTERNHKSMKKLTSQIRDIFTLKSNHLIVFNTKDQRFKLTITALGMMIITILFGYLLDMHSNPSYMFLMTNTIYSLIYFTHLISCERMFMAKTNTKYSLFLGILPDAWSVLGPYILSQTLMVLILSTFFSWIVFVVAILAMIALIFTTFLINHLPNISYWRYFKSAILFSILLYIVTSLFEGMYLSLGYALSLSLVVLLDVLRTHMHRLPKTHRYYVDILKFMSRPIFLLTWVLIALFSLVSSLLHIEPSIFKLSPIMSTPNILDTLTREYAPFGRYLELPGGNVLADSSEKIAILDRDLNILFEFIGDFRLVQTHPYLLKEYRKDTNETLYWILDVTTGVLHTPEHMHLYEEREGFHLIESSDRVIYLFNSRYYDYAFFDVYQDDTVVRHEFVTDDAQYVHVDACHALIHVNGKYSYLGCIGSRYEVINAHMEPTSIHYSQGRFLIETNVEGYPQYYVADVNNRDHFDKIESVGNWMNQYTFHEKTLWMRKNSLNHIGCSMMAVDIQRIHPKRGIIETLTICTNQVYLLHGKIIIQRYPNGAQKTTFDVVDAYDMNRYVIRQNTSLGTRLFLPLFFLSLLATSSLQFKKLPFINHSVFFQDMYKENE